MANTYYRYVRDAYSAVSLTAIEPKLAGADANNMILLTVEKDGEKLGICLTEQEQDDLMVGILERRGGYAVLAKYAKVLHRIGTEFMEQEPKGIPSNGNKKSKIHPAKC